MTHLFSRRHQSRAVLMLGMLAATFALVDAREADFVQVMLAACLLSFVVGSIHCSFVCDAGHLVQRFNLFGFRVSLNHGTVKSIAVRRTDAARLRWWQPPALVYLGEVKVRTGWGLRLFYVDNGLLDADISELRCAFPEIVVEQAE